MMRTKLFFVIMAMLSISLFWMSCGEDNEPNEPATQPPVVNFSIANDGCEAPCDITFTNTSISQGTTTLSWDFGDNGSAGNESPVVHTYTEAGTYDVTLTAQNEAGTDAEVKTVTVLEAAMPPVADFAINYTSANCNAPCIVQFTNLSTGGDDNVLSWDFGDGNTAGDINFADHTYETGGTYQVTLTVTNSIGSDTKTEEVIIEDANNYSAVRLHGMEYTVTLLPFDLNIAEPFTCDIKDDLGQIVAATGSPSVGQPLPINWGFGSGIDSDRYDETFVLTVANDGNTASFSFVPSDYLAEPGDPNNCHENNFVENGIGIVFDICWIY